MANPTGQELAGTERNRVELLLSRSPRGAPWVLHSDSLGNPSVHSLSVTLGNHAFHVVQTYNWPCPVGHLPICEMDRRGLIPGAVPLVRRALLKSVI